MTARRWWALPLLPIYAAVLWLVRRLRGLGWLESRTLRWPVLSVGSLSAGGAGKTPFVMALATLLSERGWVVDVLSRGYGRDGERKAIDLVDPDRLDAAVHYGDEPTLIAQSTGVPVWVGADRYLAGQRAEGFSGGDRWDWGRDTLIPEAQAPSVHLLDDGFQHARLVRTLDIVLVTAGDLRDWLLPVGSLREPLKSLLRADVVVLREEEAATLEPLLERWFAPRRPLMWQIRRALDLPSPTVSILSGGPCYVAGTRPLVFCGLARPQAFLDELERAGCPVHDSVLFPDHYRYTAADMRRLASVAGDLQATGFITTEKDAVKLTPSMREILEQTAPLMIVPLNAALIDPDRVVADIAAVLDVALALQAEVETGTPPEQHSDREPA